MAMSGAEFDAVELLGRCYEAAINPELWGDALDHLARAFNARGAILPAATFIPGVLPHSSAMKDVLAQFFEERWHEHDDRTIAAQRYIFSQDLVTDQDLFTSAEIARSRYYDGFARAAGVPWFCAATLAVDGANDYVALSLQRSQKQDMFGTEERVALRALLPHLRNAARVAKMTAEYRGKAMLDGLDAARVAAAVVDRQGRVIARNMRFDALHHPALHIHGNRIEAASAISQRELASLLACVSQPAGWPNAAAKPIALRSEAGALPLILQAAPLCRSASDPFGADATLITLRDPNLELGINTAHLRALFALTPREAQVLALLAEGHDLPHIAEALTISRGAVRFHLKALFAKTDTRRQSALVALAIRSAI